MQAGYLERLGVDQPGPPTHALLTELQVRHLLTVPFENLDSFHHREVRTDLEWSVPKIVDRGRGGWCFELNGAFGWLLTELGFEVDTISCRVMDDDGWGPPLDHCANIVSLDGQRWFVDVGFGDFCIVPIPLVDGEHPGTPRPVRCRVDDDDFILAELLPDGSWADQLRGTIEPVPLTAFTARSDYLRTEPGLSWSEKPFATRATDRDGSRITLRTSVLRTRQGTGEFVDRPVDPSEWSALLSVHFGLADTLTRTDPQRDDTRARWASTAASQSP